MYSVYNICIECMINLSDVGEAVESIEFDGHGRVLLDPLAEHLPSRTLDPVRELSSYPARIPRNG